MIHTREAVKGVEYKMAPFVDLAHLYTILDCRREHQSLFVSTVYFRRLSTDCDIDCVSRARRSDWIDQLIAFHLIRLCSSITPSPQYKLVYVIGEPHDTYSFLGYLLWISLKIL